MAVRNLLQVLIVGVFLLLFTGCMPKQDDVKSAFQTNAATIIKKDQKRLQKLIVKLKTKLDKRNPKAFDKELKEQINNLVSSGKNSFYLKHENQELVDYKEYLELAFSKENIEYRTDFLILGIYYQFYEAYSLKSEHKVLALEYDKEKLTNLHKNLQVLKWKIKVNRDLNDEYLFLTWQNNWQIELEKKLKNNPSFTYDEIKDLKYIKNKKENLYSPSNFSFEVLISKMITNTEHSLKKINVEPYEVSISAIKSFVFIL